jgi:OFA family oxalate/formate antiporter-like MFS transporter
MPAKGLLSNRWFQLALGILAMLAIANLQYAWTFFVTPLQKHYHTQLAVIQFTFFIFILAETWLVPLEGFLIDKVGPRVIMAIGGVLVGLGWFGSGNWAPTIQSLYFWYVLGGIGAGAVYGGTIGNAMKWFPDHRGLAVGLTAGSYGIGTALSVAPIAAMITKNGYQYTFGFWGILQGIVVFLAALFIVAPPKGWVPAGWSSKVSEISARVRMTGREFHPIQMFKTHEFWVLYLMMTLMAFTGLVITVQVAPIAKFYHVDKTIVWFGLTALVLAVEVDRILNGITRPFWGWISDRVGRENAMFAAFSLQAVTIIVLTFLTKNPVAFILLTGFAFFTWGEIFSLFPAAVGDLFGRKYATTNYGFLYTAKGTASFFSAPVAAYVTTNVKHGDWTLIFYVMAGCAAIAALMALFWLKPVTRRAVEGARRAEASSDAGPATAPGTPGVAPAR